ncbi:restriction endonuclease, partial [Streptococcus pneumoniae]
GWYKAKNNLRETFDLPFLYNINDLEHNILKNLK